MGDREEMGEYPRLSTLQPSKNFVHKIYMREVESADNNEVLEQLAEI